MPLRERMDAIKIKIPEALQHDNVQKAAAPSPNGKKLKELAKKTLTELLTNEKFLDANIAAIEKQLHLVPKSEFERRDGMFKNIEALMKQCRQTQALVAKNVANLEKMLTEIKKEFGIR